MSEKSPKKTRTQLIFKDEIGKDLNKVEQGKKLAE